MDSEPNGVDIESSSAALAEARLHRALLRRARCSVVEPVRINGASSPCQAKRNRGTAVVLVQDADLGADLRRTAEIA